MNKKPHYLLNKPTPPVGYRMLIEGTDTASAYDFIWVIDKDDSQRWAHSIKQTPGGLCMSSDTGKPYKEPTEIEDYCFFRCRKVGAQR